MATTSKGQVIWITALSGAGKTTLAREVANRLRSAGESVVVLDGDQLREVFGTTGEAVSNYSRARRQALSFQYARLCQAIASQGFTVVIATISLFKELHAWNRDNLPGYFEVYLKVPIEELRRRDPKGLYRRFDAGEISDVAGLDFPIDEPKAADFVIEFEPGSSVELVTDRLLSVLRKSQKV